jgi:putative transposase
MKIERRPARLKRFSRLFTSQPLYFVTANTQNRKPILANDEVHQSFRRFCENGLMRGVFVGKYVLMPDHLHLFVAFSGEFESKIIKRGPSPLSEWVKSLKNSISKTLRGRKVRTPHWQKGFFDHVMRSEESYSQKWLYVAENPVRASLAVQPDAWPYQGEIYPLEAKGHEL